MMRAVLVILEHTAANYTVQHTYLWYIRLTSANCVCMGGPSAGDGEQECGGCTININTHLQYMLALWHFSKHRSGQFTNGFPLWRRAGMGAAMWLYSGNKGFLVIWMCSDVKCFKWINSWSRIKKRIQSWFVKRILKHLTSQGFGLCTLSLS